MNSIQCCLGEPALGVLASLCWTGLGFPLERPKSVTTELVKDWLKGEGRYGGIKGGYGQKFSHICIINCTFVEFFTLGLELQRS